MLSITPTGHLVPRPGFAPGTEPSQGSVISVSPTGYILFISAVRIRTSTTPFILGMSCVLYTL